MRCRIIALVVCVIAPNLSFALSDPLCEDPREQELLTTLRAERYIRAREQAEALLKEKPNSLIGRYALARVFHLEEANLPRALFYMREVERSLLARFGGSDHKPPPRLPVQAWHRRVLIAQEQLLAEMDRREEQLAIIDRYDRFYDPDEPLRRIWPLMKLHRFDEAIAIAKQATLAEELQVRIAGFNGLLSVEFERERPVECFRLASQAVAATGEQSCILDLNTAEAAFAVFRFADAERLALQSLRASIKDCPISAHLHLATLYQLRGDFQRTVSAVKDARDQGVTRRLREQFEMTITSALMRLLYTLGRFDAAFLLAERIVRLPDRVGLVSYSSDEMETIYTLDYLAALRGRIEVLREKASARPFWDAASIWIDAARLELKAWTTERKALKLLGEKGRLRSMLRPYIKPFPAWNAPTLLNVAGPGVSRTAIAQIREKLKQKKAHAYLDLLLGELAYRDGDFERALTLSGEALELMSPDEVLLRARGMAWSAEAARRVDNLELAKRYFHLVLESWPTALRVLGVRLPVTINADQTDLAQRVADQLHESRRLRVGDSLGFTVRAFVRGQRAAICLSGARGKRYACAEEPDRRDKEEKLSEDERIAQLIDTFHREVFAPRVDLTQADINSLDGSATRGTAKDVIRQLFE